MSEKKLGTTGLNALVTKIKTAIAEILGLIDDEETARTEADTTINNRISSVNASLSTSIGLLSTHLNTEIADRETDVANLETDVATKVSKSGDTMTGTLITPKVQVSKTISGTTYTGGIQVNGNSGLMQLLANGNFSILNSNASTSTAYGSWTFDSDITGRITKAYQDQNGLNIQGNYLKMHYTDVNSLTNALAIRFPYATYFGHGNATIMTAVNGYSFILNIGFYKAASASIQNISLHVVNSHNNAVSNYYIPKVYYDNTASSEQVIYLVWNTGSDALTYRLNCLLACDNYNSVTVDTATMATATAATELGSSNYFANPWYDNTGAVGSSTTPVYVNANGKILAASSVNADTVDGYHVRVGTTPGTASNTIYLW